MEKVKLTNSEKDLELLDVVKNGEKKDAEKAFAILFNKYKNLILFSFRTRVLNEANAEDLAMEVMAKCYQSLDKYKPECGAFSTWIFTLTKNLFIDNYRKQKKNLVSINDLGVIDDNGHYTNKELATLNLNAEEIILKEEKNQALTKLIAKVLDDKPHLKEILEMRYFSELSYEEIAKLTNCPIGTVKAYLFRAKGLLKDAVKKDNIKL